MAYDLSPKLFVLNAFRHQRTIHEANPLLVDSNGLCSTPFGINERFTPAPPDYWLLSGCAQRLSASTNDSLFDPTASAPVVGCAQRLSASTNDSHVRSVALLAGIGAQRLSASTNVSPKCSTPFGINERFTIYVLNAFRHQRTIHNSASTSVMSVNDVLNAFRHQRTFHKLVLNAFRHQRTFHQGRPQLLAGQRVLNAFRHQRTFHSPGPGCRSRPSCAQRLSASTNDSPFDRRRCLGAQRLSASTNDSPAAFGLSLAKTTKCSTPFGINERFT